MVVSQAVIDGGDIDPAPGTTRIGKALCLDLWRQDSAHQQQSRSEAMNETHSLASCRIVL